MCHSRQKGYYNAEGPATGQEAERRARIGKGPIECTITCMYYNASIIFIVLVNLFYSYHTTYQSVIRNVQLSNTTNYY